MKSKLSVVFLFTVLFFFSEKICAQNNVGIGTLTPNTKALLDLTANNKGILVPRLSAADRIAINPTGNTDAALLVYDTDSNLFFFGTAINGLLFQKVAATIFH